MPSLKEIFILVFVLFGSLAIVLSSPGQQGDKNKNIQPPKNINSGFSVFKSETKQFNKSNQNKIAAPPETSLNNKQQAVLDKNQAIEDISIVANNQESSSAFAKNDINIITPLSPEIVLSEAKNLSSDLKLEFEKIQERKENCPTCGQTEQSSGSICTTILASPGGGGCNCDNAMGPCYTDTPYGRVWHCAGLCCCACCPVCCR
ncbi:MAG: hypothetical protein U9P63_01635 [Patescibacteria group bacterium]|nr:hypothetical protein [Patescibacteria group bacterium]